MRLRQLFEVTQTVGFIFGRFNPPHKGHKAAWEMLSENDHWYVGTNKSTQGPKDPLPYDVKIKAMSAIWPEVADHIIPHQSWLTLAAEIYKKHGEVELKVYTDEAWVLKTLDQYNGVEKTHGYYNFPKITSVATPRLSSATALRKAVADDNRDAFADAAGVPADTPVDGKPFFDLVAEYLNTYKKEDASGEEEDEFHRKLDKLVHKTFGHSSDEKKKKNKKYDEIWGFARGSSKRKTFKKKKEEPNELSVQDRIAARRKAAAKGDKDAWASKKELPTDEAQVIEDGTAEIAAMAAVAGLAAPVMAAMIRGAFKTGKGLLKVKKIAQQAGVKLSDKIVK